MIMLMFGHLYNGKKYYRILFVKNINETNAMQNIEKELLRASERNYITDISSTNSEIIARFSPSLKLYTVNIVMKHLSIKYGSFVHVHKSDSDNRLFYIWNKNNQN